VAIFIFGAEYLAVYCGDECFEKNYSFGYLAACCGGEFINQDFHSFVLDGMGFGMTESAKLVLIYKV